MSCSTVTLCGRCSTCMSCHYVVSVETNRRVISSHVNDRGTWTSTSESSSFDVSTVMRSALPSTVSSADMSRARSASTVS